MHKTYLVGALVVVGVLFAAAEAFAHPPTVTRVKVCRYVDSPEEPHGMERVCHYRTSESHTVHPSGPSPRSEAARDKPKMDKKKPRPKKVKPLPRRQPPVLVRPVPVGPHPGLDP